ncbi:DUF4837 family protein [Marinoscillum sp. MHG1-6]|uniref:DUF4837 family protein n=1 Tax=Marinoscillum sp. MHG1-6 TaxID=2959627 RepID=UPI002158911D|nr:DUF4837 family protein [Marinoscillum sp. MHG1-6]
MKLTHITLFTILIYLLGCQQTKERVQKEFQKNAKGEADEMIIVMDSTQWNGSLGQTVKDTYRSYLIGLPQDEPKFSVHQVNPSELNTTLRSAVNMVFVMTLDNESSQSKRARSYFSDASLKKIQGDTSLYMTLRKDVFAKGQLVLYLFSKSEEILIEKIKDNQKYLTEIFESAVRERVRASLFKEKEKQMMKSIEEDHGYSINIPFGWDMAKNLNDFVWIRKLEHNMEWAIFIHEADYTDQSIFNDVGKYRDQITERYLTDSDKPDIHITRQFEIPVFTERVNFNGHFAVEGRGLWKISDNSGGGPFVSYTFVDEENQKIYYVEGYVYSPGTKKKKMVREVEAVISTFRCPSDLQKS